MINLRKDLIKIIFAVSVLIPSVSFSAPLFYPGETLDPGCLPSDPDCTVSTSTPIWALNGSNATYLTGNIGIGTSTPGAKLDIYGSGTSDIFGVSSTGNERLFTITSAGKVGIGTSTPESFFEVVHKKDYWVAQTAAEANSWESVTYGNGLFVAVSQDGANQVMTSPDGITWTARTAAEANGWTSITYGNGLFVAVAYSGTNRVMTSPDGVTWTSQTATEANSWFSVTYGNGTFVAVSGDGTHRVMTSPDGITWTARTAAEANSWYSVTYGNGLFVATAYDGTNQVMTSPDGITWTARTAAEANGWTSITYGNGLFVAVAWDGANQVMTSPDGSTWTARTAAEANNWRSVTYSNGKFVAIAQSGTHRVMTSPDGITWTAQSAAEAALWSSVTFGNGTFVAVAQNDAHVMILSDVKFKLFTIGDNGSTTINGLTTINGSTTINGLTTINGSTTINGLTTISGGFRTDTFLDSTNASGTSGMILQSTGTSTLWTDPNINKSGYSWTAQSAAEANNWRSVTYGNGTFVAVAVNGVDRVMISSDGINWATSTATEQNTWFSVTYGNGLFVAVSLDGTNRVMTSPDGINWTAKTAPELNEWTSVTYGNGLFVAVARSGTHRVMTSPDGINWTARTAAEANSWYSVTYGDGTFVAVSGDGTHRVMTSPDGITWTARTAAEANYWWSVTYGDGKFVAVSSLEAGTHGVMTSPDGVTWTARTAAEANQWRSVTYGNSLFVAVASGGTHRVMTSPDGTTWTTRTATEANSWFSVTYGNGTFVAVSYPGGVYQVMTSGKTELNIISTKNIYQGGMSIFGNVGIGTSSPSTNLQVQGGLRLTGSFFDSVNASGTSGMILQSTGTSTLWTDPNTLLGKPGYSWTSQTATEANSWFSVTYGNGTFVAVSVNGTNRVMTSPDGVNWTAQTAAEINLWTSVTYGNGLFVAVAQDGTNRVMTSPDGSTWTARTAAEANDWRSVTYGNGTFVATAINGTNRVMTSPDGVSWTARTAAEANNWYSVTYGNGKFVAIANTGTNRVMTSPDGATWTAQTAAEANGWDSITYGNGLFVAVAQDGTNRVMTSPDGSTWTARTAAEANTWYSVTYGNGLFVAVSTDGTNRVMTSPDGATWTAQEAAEANLWTSVTYGNGLFVAVAANGTYRVMTSGKSELNIISTKNIYQGGMSIFGNVGIGTSTPMAKLDIYGTAGTADIFGVSSSSNSRLFTIGYNGSTTISSLGSGVVRADTNGALYTDANTYLTSNQIADIGTYSDIKNPLLYYASFTDAPSVIKTVIVPGATDYGTWDGKNIWVGSFSLHTISKVNADGVILNTYTLASNINPLQMAYDGRYIWVGSGDTYGHLVKFDPISETVVATYIMNPLGTGAGGVQGVIWDGSNIWIGVAQDGGGAGSGFVAKLDSSGNILASSTGQTNVNGMAFTDVGGVKSIWAACRGFLSKINSSDMTYSTSTAGDHSYRIVTDGQYMYDSDFFGNVIRKYKVSDGTLVTTWPSGNLLNTLAFDGRYVWTSGDNETVTIHDKDTGAIVYTIPNGGRSDLIFDGVYMWSISRTDGSVRKITLGNLSANTKIYDGLSILSTGSATTSTFLSGTSTVNSFIMSNLGIGTSTPSATLTISGTPTSTLLRLVGFGAGSLSTDASGNVIISSDERLKDIQSNFDRGLEDIMKINPISYKWKPETGLDTGSVYSGFSAQNMQLAIPEAVGSSSAGYLTLSDRPVIAALVNSVKQIGSFISKIEGGIAYLKNVVVENFTVGSNVSPAGITMYDRTTKQPYCVFMNNGSWSSEQGECSSDTVTSVNNTVSVGNHIDDTIVSTSTETTTDDTTIDTTISTSTATTAIDTMIATSTATTTDTITATSTPEAAVEPTPTSTEEIISPVDATAPEETLLVPEATTTTPVDISTTTPQ